VSVYKLNVSHGESKQYHRMHEESSIKRGQQEMHDALSYMDYEIALSVDERYKVDPFVKHANAHSCLFYWILQNLFYNNDDKSVTYKGRSKILVHKILLKRWLTRYKYLENILTEEVLHCDGSIMLINDCNLRLNEQYGDTSVTVLNLVCYIGDIDLLNFLIDLFGDKLINLIQQ